MSVSSPKKRRRRGPNRPPTNERLGMDEITTGSRVIRACGWSPAVMTASKAGGYVFQYGTRTTKRHYLRWRSRNPKFTSTAYVRAHSKKEKDAPSRGRGHGQRRSARRGADVRKSRG